jgi:hypothetical protein
MAIYVANFAIEFRTRRLLYILICSRMTYSAMKMKNCYIMIFFKKHIGEKSCKTL